MSSEFVFAGSIWFIAGKPPYGSLDELAVTILAGEFGDRREPVVYAFSDQDLAERFLAQAGANVGPYIAMTLASDAELIALLKGLQDHGHEQLAIDVSGTSAVVGTIESVIRQIEQRRTA